ncbi:preprotein translocase, SecE subunit [Thermococcus kodakarensis KOD1]|uniref:Protein translocase subunit SecE n=1 Tax=Thermococcus kodakarensis (strain ATCC BAA-918 / JCM 12380 / KOD1) TaxID=69014 RepID=SECE_THEKO|nr:protein translocase SEC61 complex subunit gamma [Thermococcus kodakarensis]Q5JH32.1 RecName: Full=Protein translocase subunit SecE; AltName: Full=Protein transport protein Sec61 gamma subunit homolog [Thermococcus kodakarensis KOD1]WCN27393.1 protein translocase SEC61 complex subunit gamma [Thermococcus kodakarensis]WCN29683.1 protein translocase SEC61 complex subunit gamma [Thermococcus kodakarensis]BAD85609.1 preprotein translocase, SecE subunit [Thermococcus kodakarensis KOD1]
MAEFTEKVKSFLAESKRVLLVTKKPGMKEFKLAAKITGIGMILIGTIGMIIRIIGYLVTGS